MSSHRPSDVQSNNELALNFFPFFQKRPRAGCASWIRAGGRDLRSQLGDVCSSSHPSHCRACARLWPHMNSLGCREPHTAGRSGCPKILQRSFSSSCTQRTPAGLPSGIPGIGLDMEGAVQQAPQSGRHATMGWLVVEWLDIGLAGEYVIPPRRIFGCCRDFEGRCLSHCFHLVTMNAFKSPYPGAPVLEQAGLMCVSRQRAGGNTPRLQ